MTSYLRHLVESGALSAQDAEAIAQASAQGIDSLNSINALPQNVQSLVRDAFRQGSRYAFISLIPWCALAFITSLFLSKISDSDRERALAAPDLSYEHSEPKDEEKGSPELKTEERLPETARP